MSNVGVLIFFAIVGSVICARARVAGGAVVFGGDRGRAVRRHADRVRPAGRGVARFLSTIKDVTAPVTQGSPRRCRMSAGGTGGRPRACRDADPELFFPTAAVRSGLRGAGRRGQGRLRGLPGPGGVPRRGAGPHPGRHRGRTDPRGAPRPSPPGRRPRVRGLETGLRRGARRSERRGGRAGAAGRRSAGAGGRPPVRGLRTHRRPLGRAAPATDAACSRGRRGAAAATGLPSRSPRRPTPWQGHERRKEPS